VYAIVKTGGKQYKVAVGDTVEVEKLTGAAGSTLTLPAVLVVDGSDVTSDAKALAGFTVDAEVVAQTKGPKIRILKYKNKTGYRKRIGHRQQLTQVRVTGISGGSAKSSAKSTSPDTGKAASAPVDTDTAAADTTAADTAAADTTAADTAKD